MVPAVDVDDKIGECASVNGSFWRLGNNVSCEDHGWSLFVARYVRHRPRLFWKIEEVRSTVERVPFFSLICHNPAGRVIRRVPQSFDESPIVRAGLSINFGEMVIDEKAVNFGFVLYLFKDGFAVGPHNCSDEWNFNGVDDSIEDLPAIFRPD